MCLWVDTHCVDMHAEARRRDLAAPSLFTLLLKTRLFMELETHWLDQAVRAASSKELPASVSPKQGVAHMTLMMCVFGT